MAPAAKRRFPTLTPERRNELWGILLFAGSLLLFMSLMSYHSDDLPFFTNFFSRQNCVYPRPRTQI